jgi:hypothetical protein
MFTNNERSSARCEISVDRVSPGITSAAPGRAPFHAAAQYG